jgi:hypothetical protein
VNLTDTTPEAHAEVQVLARLQPPPNTNAPGSEIPIPPPDRWESNYDLWRLADRVVSRMIHLVVILIAVYLLVEIGIAFSSGSIQRVVSQ